MERLRPPRSDPGSSVERLAPLPSTATLPALLEAVRSPGVLRADVDALLRGLALPLAEGEAPRDRADFLLSLIESNDVNDMEGFDGRTVRSVAVQALLDLGYPYALELPPEALDEVRASRGKPGVQKLPIAGLIATFVGLTVQSYKGLPAAFKFLFDENPAVIPGLILLGALLGPALSAVLGGWQRIRWLQHLGVLTMALTGSFWLMAGYFLLFGLPGSPRVSDVFTVLTAGLGFLLGAILTRSPEWLPAETPPAPKELPQQEPPASP